MIIPYKTDFNIASFYFIYIDEFSKWNNFYSPVWNLPATPPRLELIVTKAGKHYKKLSCD